MKKMHDFTIAVAVASLALMTAHTIRADESSTTTTTIAPADGTVAEYSPNNISVQTMNAEAPVQYVATKTTTYVDENGNPVAVETVRTGAPVTVYSSREGDRLIATKVVVRRSDMVVPAAPVMEKSTTATTMVKKADD